MKASLTMATNTDGSSVAESGAIGLTDPNVDTSKQVSCANSGATSNPNGHPIWQQYGHLACFIFGALTLSCVLVAVTLSTMMLQSVWCPSKQEVQLQPEQCNKSCQFLCNETLRTRLENEAEVCGYFEGGGTMCATTAGFCTTLVNETDCYCPDHVQFELWRMDEPGARG